jgi:hypothetical protein
MNCRLPSLVASSDIEKGNLVGTSIAVALRHFDRVSSITDIEKLDAFYDASVLAIETGDYSFC